MTAACIDEEPNKHLASLSNYRTQNNSSLPIFRLPPEMLEAIFTRGVREYHESNADPTFRVPRWVNVSYVCRRWRDVALNCPTLWTYPFIVSLRWMEELLARSKQASLKIRIYFVPLSRTLRWWSDLVRKVLSHAGRIQELRLRLPVKAFPSKHSLCAPRLQILDIDGTWNLSPRSLTINDGDISSLCTLKLTGCPLPWHSLDLSRLTTLFLCRIPTPKQNIGEFLATLNRMQGLTVLHLDDALAGARGFLSSGAFNVSPDIGLPCLVRLLVAGPLSTVVALLSCINIPLKTKLRLKFEKEDGSSVEDYAQIPSVLAQRFTQSKDLSSLTPTIRSLAIRYLPTQSSFTLCASEHVDRNLHGSIKKPRWGSGLPLVISVEMNRSMTNSDREHITSDICCSIPSMDVQTLYVTEPLHSLDFWRKTLGHLPGLRHMRLSLGYMPNLVSLLTLPADEPEETPRGHGPTPGHIFVPALEELELHCIRFASVSKILLLDALATRKAPRPRLTMAASSVQAHESDTESDDG